MLLRQQMPLDHGSEKLDLSGHLLCFGGNGAQVTLHFGVLLVCKLDDADLTVWWEAVFDSLDVNRGIFVCWTRSRIDRVLNHIESILEEIFPKTRGGLLLTLG